MNMMTETTQFNLPTLADRAMIVRLKRSFYQPYAFDKATTEKVELDTGIRKAGRFNKRLFLDCHQLKTCNAAWNDLYAFHIHHSAPWLDDGMRVVPNKAYFEYRTEIRALIDEAERQADALARAWDILVAEDMARLGPLANTNDYPRDIRSRYNASIQTLPIPTASDFRVAVSDEDRQSLQDALQEAEGKITKYLIGELLAPVQKAIEKLAVPIGAEGSVFRDSLLENITEQVERARSLNISDDPSVNELCDKLQATVGGFAQAPDLLRENMGARSSVQEELAAIMRKMGGVG